MTHLPSVLILDIHENRGEEIIRLISKIEDVDSIKIQDNLSSCKWRIDNKYYHADVNLCSSNLQTSFPEDFKNSIEAVIVLVNIDRESWVDELNKWINQLEDLCIAEKILLCKTCKGLNETKKDAVNNWCIHNGYELVELEPETEDDCDTVVPEVVGADRVIEVLHSHQWPNLIMKENIFHTINSSNFENSEKSVSKVRVSENSSKAKDQNEEVQMDKEFENMEQLAILFKNLQSMKSEMCTLSTKERVDQAEKAVKAFWNAVGGDEDEFSDSSGDNGDDIQI